MNWNELVTNSRIIQGTDTNNSTATVAAAAVPGMRHHLVSIYADYSATVSAIQTITLTIGSLNIVWRWDFSKGPFLLNFGLPVHTDYNQALTVALQASGSGGVTGRPTIVLATI